MGPTEAFDLPGLEVATRFHAVAGGDAGGDFYDVVPMGRPADEPTAWAIVIGDVQGRGAAAASVSGAARHALRAAAGRETTAAALLQALNGHLLARTTGAGDPTLCTAAVVVVEPDGDGAALRIAVGGHPPPLVLRTTGETTPVEPGGPLVGLLPDAEFGEAQLRLGPGDAVVLYTDGVTAWRAGSAYFDEESLAAVLSRCVGFTSAVLAERIETASRAFVEDAPRDDLAIVVARVPERTATPTTTSVDLPADDRAPAMATRFVTAALDVLGAAETAEDAALLTTELVTNALVHGAPPYRIAVEGLEDGLRVAVSDGGPGEPAADGRGLQLVAAVARRWGTTPNPLGGKAVWFELHQ